MVRKDTARIAGPQDRSTGADGTETDELARLRGAEKEWQLDREILRRTRLMRIHHVVGRHLRRTKRTTIADKSAPPAPDLVMRDFTATAVDTKWCGDITS